MRWRPGRNSLIQLTGALGSELVICICLPLELPLGGRVVLCGGQLRELLAALQVLGDELHRDGPRATQ